MSELEGGLKSEEQSMAKIPAEGPVNEEQTIEEEPQESEELAEDEEEDEEEEEEEIATERQEMNLLSDQKRALEQQIWCYRLLLSKVMGKLGVHDGEQIQAFNNLIAERFDAEKGYPYAQYLLGGKEQHQAIEDLRKMVDEVKISPAEEE